MLFLPRRSPIAHELDRFELDHRNQNLIEEQEILKNAFTISRYSLRQERRCDPYFTLFYPYFILLSSRSLQQIIDERHHFLAPLIKSFLSDLHDVWFCFNPRWKVAF